MNDGIYTDISIVDYHANKTHLSATQIKKSRRSLKELHWYLEGKIERIEKMHLDFGNAVELALMNKSLFDQCVAVMDDKLWVDLAMQEKDYDKPRASAIYKKEKDAFMQQSKGKYVIMDHGPESHGVLTKMIESCEADPTIKKLLGGTEYQVSIFWTDPYTGLKLKTRPDVCKAKKNVLVNVKTTLDGSPAGFSRDLAKYDYPIQACIEIDGCVQSGFMDSVDNYFWLVLEKTPPYNATLYEFDPRDIELFSDHTRWLYSKIARAQKNNLWPGYTDLADNPHGILTANIPAYYK